MLVQAGMDPMQALQQVGPDLADPTELIAMKQKADQLAQAQKYRESQLGIETQKLEYEKARLAAPDAQQKEREDYAKYVQQEAQLMGLLKANPTDTEAQAKLKDVQTKKQAWEVMHNAREESTSIDFPGGGGVRIVRGGAGKSPTTPTTAEETRLGNDIQSTANSLRVLNRLEGQLNAGAVGILPTLSTVIFDEVLGQLAPDLVDKNRVAARQNVGVATQQVLGELNNQGRISNMELNAIKNAMPGLGALSSAEQGKIKIRELQKVLAEKGAHAAITLKRDIPSETLQTLSRMTDEELAKDAQQGALDPKVFWKVYRMKHPQSAAPQQPQPTP